MFRRGLTATVATVIFAGLAAVTATPSLGATSSSASSTVRAKIACTTDQARQAGQAEQSPWSVSPSYGSSWAPAGWAPQMAGIGVQNVRGFRTDANQYAAIRSAGLNVTGILQWSPTDGTYRFPVDDLPGWSDYVRQMVTSYPDVQQWEVWNEPPNFTGNGSPANYATIVTAAYDAAKAVNPDVQIGLSTKATFVKWLGESIEAGAAGHFDYVTVHPYERAADVFDGGEASFLSIVPQLRTMLAELSPAQRDVPVQFTEVGSPAGVRAGQPANAYSNPRDQASLLVKVMTMSVAQGAQRVSWYDPFDGDYSAGEAPYGLIALNGTPRPAFGAYRNVIAALGATPQYEGVVTPDSSTYIFAFGCEGARTTLVAWSGSKRQLTFPTKVAVTDPITGAGSAATRVTLGSAPTIITVDNAPLSRTWTARAAAGQAMRENSRSLITWSARTGANGLQVLGGSRPKLVRGLTAVSPAGAGLKLAVDSQFLPGTPSSVVVTARVLALKGAPGFNLKYDSSRPLDQLDWAGQRSTGSWSSVPAGGWKTLTWRINDFQSSGMYGFSLRMDSDSPSYAGYAISDISVRVA